MCACRGRCAVTREEFLSAASQLVGSERGTLRRLCRLLGFSERTAQAINQGVRPVPAAYAAKVRGALAESQARGGAVTFVAPRLEAVVQAAVRAGWSREDALAAVAAWASLGLVDGRERVVSLSGSVAPSGRVG